MHPSKWHAQVISIHALRVEGDDSIDSAGETASISIHALRVEGDVLGARRNFGILEISIHALRVEGDIDFIKNVFTGN